MLNRSAVANASWFAARNTNSHPCARFSAIRSLTCACVYFELAFSSPSVRIATITFAGRASTARAANDVVIFLIVRPIASSSAVLPRG
jgi:hypothetical protein